MRKLVVLTFISLDGVMQAPGGPKEDVDGGFQYGGWTFPFFDESLGKEMSVQMGHEFDLLLGRRTYDIFASYWPNVTDPFGAGINNANKYVATHSALNSDWKNSYRIEGDVAEGVRKLKAGDGAELQVHGSSNLIQTLLKHDLVDEFWLKIFPVTLGEGKRLFGDGSIAAGFELAGCKSTAAGVIIANYRRSGSVKTGSF